MFGASKFTAKPLRKKILRRQRQVTSLGVQAEGYAERYFFKRLDRLGAVRRFVVGWLLLFVLVFGALVGQIRALSSYYQTLQPTIGGIYTEGIVGDFTNANPLYATGPVDESVSKLLFASLFKYDDRNHLVGDLAKDYSVDQSGKVYTVTLKPDLKWHDNQLLTARDVVYTYHMIQNPDAQSILYQSWQGIVVNAVNDSTINFTLPSTLGSFPYNLTNGIIPEHALVGVTAGELRSANFNTANPVGAGPFKWDKIEVTGNSPETRQSQIALTPSQHYNAGVPKFASFVVHAFHTKSQLTTSFKNRELTAANFQDTPLDITALSSTSTHSFMLSAANMVFFKQSNPVLAELAVRKALVQSANVDSIIKSLDYPTHAVRGPFLLGQLGYDKALLQPGFDLTAAAAMLDSAGWKPGLDGIRMKNNLPLRFTVDGQDMPESRQVATALQKSWRSIGVQATIKLMNSQDLQRIISSHDYDALLYGISIGIDPDVYVYWHSSQNDARSNRLNFSEYKSKTADMALEAGRTRIDSTLRVVKYHPFLQAWQQDTPSLGLYQPRYLYLTHGTVYGLKDHIINTDTDRYDNVQNWEIRQASVTN